MSKPQINQGLLTEETNDEGLRKMAEVLSEADTSRLARQALEERQTPDDSLSQDPAEPPPTNSAVPAAQAKPKSTEAKTDPPPAKRAPGTSAKTPAAIAPANQTAAAAALENPSKPVIDVTDSPSENAKLITLPKLNQTELSELLSSLELKLGAEKSYKAVAPGSLRVLPPLPEGMTAGPILAKPSSEGRAILRIGYRRFLSQPTRLWAQGVLLDNKGGISGRNTDLESIDAAVEMLLASVEQMKKGLSAGDLAHELIRLSYIDVKGAMLALKGFGIETAEDLAQIPSPVAFEKLPLVAPMPSPSAEQTRLLGSDKEATKGAFELSVTPSIATPLPSDANTARASQLLVYYHPAHPEQFSKIKKLLNEYIDRPDRQIFVEGMVLEVSEDGLKDLGVEWQFREGNFDWIIGSISPAGLAQSTAQFGFDSLKDADKNWVAKLKALVRSGKAEVLSRPSVLTLNNRQATIRVGTDIPIATSQQEGGFSGPGQVAFNFKYLATGISLNVMPRANESGNEVSLLVDTIVSQVVPGAELALRSSSGEVLASAPTISTRRIQTYARINNNTPFIIGGLVSKEHTMVRDKVPLLGDIPYLGVFFRSEKTSTKKREVIVVLTPHVLEPEQATTPGRFLPKDEDRFDDFGNALFRDTYRIRSEDIFDLKFITENPRLQHFRSVAERAIGQDFRLATVPPFSEFAENRVPGESILVRRMVWEVVRRLSTEKGQVSNKWLDKYINLERLILFESQQGGAFNVQFLERILARLGDAKNRESFLAKSSGKALVLTFPSAVPSTTPDEKITMPTPEVRMVDCAERKTWNKLLWDLNQPDAKGASRYSVILHDKSDFVRLQRALVLKKILNLNGGGPRMTLRNFNLGKILLMPEPKADQFHLVDAETAQYFFEIEKYYEVALHVIDKAMSEMEEVLKRPEFEAFRTEAGGR